MNYQEFKQQIQLSIQKQLGQTVKVTIQDIIKNNNTHLDGLTILSPKCNVSPTIYLDHYFNQYQNGRPASAICEDIISVYQSNRPAESIDISFFTDYDNVKSRIIFKLVNYDKNRELLKTVPHYRFLDLAIVFNCLLESGASGNATILIHNHHLNFWNITNDDLYALALNNTPRLLQYDLRDMTDILKELLTGTDLSCSAQENACPMYVLTNQHKINGSVCILYQNLLKNFAEQLNSDLYVLPSSVHEVLIIPAFDQISYEELSDMVRDVNSSQLSREEILSDHVYYFARETCQLTM